MRFFEDGQSRALRTQLRTLDVPRYEVTVRTHDDQLQVAVLSSPDLVRQEAWLRGQNEAGAQVRLRPADPSALVLVGPLRAEQLERMAHDGFPPAAAMAVGDNRYEAWVRLDQRPLPRGLAEALGQALNARYTDGGPHGAPATGSLAAGFVDTRDPLTQTPEGRGLFVDVVAAYRDVAPGAAALRAELLDHMRLPADYFTRAARDRVERAQGRGPVPDAAVRETAERRAPERGDRQGAAERVMGTGRAPRGRSDRGGDRG